MNIYINNHPFHYEIENLVRLYFPNEKLINTKYNNELVKPYIYTQQSDVITVTAAIDDFKHTLVEKTGDSNAKNELIMATLLYKILIKYSKMTQPWGLLTGVRPVKLYRRIIREDGIEKGTDYFKNSLFVSDKKAKLTIETEKIEKSIINLSQKNSFSLYISIPFCPSRCSYCSFVSQSIEKAEHLMQPYTELLCKEIEYSAKIANKLNLRLETVYIGGGTPTTLKAHQLDMVLKTINTFFNMQYCREVTVEAGRPDTITPEKFLVLKNNNVDRISINPQTLNDNVLNKIGRKHTSAESINAYNLAKQMGFSHINMDLIAALPTDTLDSFKNTLDKICNLNPQSITIHTLSIKRSAKLTENKMHMYKDDSVRANQMVDYSVEKLKSFGYLSYYLYRQSRMAGNLENVGWSKKGYECLYNVFVMDETHTIIGCGAGAVSKLKQYGSDHLERIFNFKFPYEYNNLFSQMLERKDKIIDFYYKYNC